MHLVEDSTFVFHRRSASFGDSKKALLKNAEKQMRKRYPEYAGLVAAWIARNHFTELGNLFSERMNVPVA